jgi:hypothetical protein
MGAHMATIIEFRGHERGPSEAAAERLPRATGQVVIFPGVRVEHWDRQHTQSGKSAVKAKSHRDLLEIE